MRENQSLRELFERLTDCEWLFEEHVFQNLAMHSMARGNGEATQGVARHSTVNSECAGAVQRARGRRPFAVLPTSL